MQVVLTTSPTCFLVWRPFIDALWATCAQSEKSKNINAPPGMVWTRQIRVRLEWTSWLLQEEHGPLRRHWDVDAYFGRYDALMMALDASPFGLGGIRVWIGKPITYLHHL